MRIKEATICTLCEAMAGRHAVPGRTSSSVYFCNSCGESFDQFDYLNRSDHFLSQGREDKSSEMLEKHFALEARLFEATGMKLFQEVQEEDDDDSSIF